MKKIFAVFAGILLATLCQFAQAAPAVVSTMTGTAQAIPGAGVPRELRVGDNVEQGETVATGDNSTLVLRFEDGQIVALTSRSRLAVNSYTYNQAEPARSNVLLSLLNGSMRAVTGLIGKSDPNKVTYRVRNATIGIRGTDIIAATDEAGEVVVTVVGGLINFTFNGKTVTISQDQGVITKNGETKAATAAEIIALVKVQSPNLAAMLERAKANDITNAVDKAVKDAAPSPSQSQTPKSTSPAATITVPGSSSGSGSGSGGGGASKQ